MNAKWRCRAPSACVAGNPRCAYTSAWIQRVRRGAMYLEMEWTPGETSQAEVRRGRRFANQKERVRNSMPACRKQGFCSTPHTVFRVKRHRAGVADGEVRTVRMRRSSSSQCCSRTVSPWLAQDVYAAARGNGGTDAVHGTEGAADDRCSTRPCSRGLSDSGRRERFALCAISQQRKGRGVGLRIDAGPRGRETAGMCQGCPGRGCRLPAQRCTGTFEAQEKL